MYIEKIIEALGGPWGLLFWIICLVIIRGAFFGRRGGVRFGEPPELPPGEEGPGDSEPVG